MIYGPWAIVIGHCVAGLCYFNSSTPAPFDNTFADEFTCEITGKLLDDISSQRTIGPIYQNHYCYNWVDEIIKEKERKRPKAPKPAPPIPQKTI